MSSTTKVVRKSCQIATHAVIIKRDHWLADSYSFIIKISSNFILQKEKKIMSKMAMLIFCATALVFITGIFYNIKLDLEMVHCVSFIQVCTQEMCQKLLRIKIKVCSY